MQIWALWQHDVMPKKYRNKNNKEERKKEKKEQQSFWAFEGIYQSGVRNGVKTQPTYHFLQKSYKTKFCPE